MVDVQQAGTLTGRQRVDSGPDPEIAKAFVKHNDLTTKLRVHRAGGDSGKDERVRQLESQLRQYAEENRALEERLQGVEGTGRGQPVPPVDSDSGLSSFAELREMLKSSILNMLSTHSIPFSLERKRT